MSEQSEPLTLIQPAPLGLPWEVTELQYEVKPGEFVVIYKQDPNWFIRYVSLGSSEFRRVSPAIQFATMWEAIQAAETWIKAQREQGE